MSSTTNMLTLLFYMVMISPSLSYPYTLKLTKNLQNSPSSQTPYDIISNVVKSTLQRAHYIKHRKNNNKPASVFSSSTLLFARKAGDYSISLSLGTPPQIVPGFFDTGSSLVWVPCTSNYTCSNCTTQNTTITTFKPKLSSTKKHVNCHNKKCAWLDEPGNPISCLNCSRSVSGDCNKPCFYKQTYGSGETSGKAIFENLNLVNKVVTGLFVGCSLISDHVPQGIVGFGRSSMSLPNQLNIKKFSHCLISHKFDDDPSKSSTLVLGDYGAGSSSISGVSYTPLLKNPKVFPFDEYYYVQLEQISVNGKTVELERKILHINSNGNGGTIVDSGSTFTSLPPGLFDPVANEYYDQLPPALKKRIVIVGSTSSNQLCVDLTGQKRVKLPVVTFEFKGGAKLDLPVDNYLGVGPDTLCLPFVNVTFDVGSKDAGPAVILGNYQQQNFHVEYDLLNERLGFKKQVC